MHVPLNKFQGVGSEDKRSDRNYGQARTESARQLGFDALKDKQLEAISAFVDGNDTFVSLPTGYGKSAIYAVLPYVCSMHFTNLRIL